MAEPNIGNTAASRGTALPAISLWQPYASLAAAGFKPYETRHFPPPLGLLGRRIALHAALRRPTRDDVACVAEAVARHTGWAPD